MSTEMQLAENVKYMKPITLPNGDTIEIPIKKTPYEMYGPPLPSGLELLDSSVTEKAEKIAANAASHVIRYIRRPPEVAVRKVKVDDDDGPREYKEAYVAKGHPFGVLLAFKEGDKLYVGWSQHNQTVLDEDTGERLEKLPFTRQDALKVAAMRALADDIVVKGKLAMSSTGTVLPDRVTKELVSFVERAERYYKMDAVNVFIK